MPCVSFWNSSRVVFAGHVCPAPTAVGLSLLPCAFSLEELCGAQLPSFLVLVCVRLQKRDLGSSFSYFCEIFRNVSLTFWAPWSSLSLLLFSCPLPLSLCRSVWALPTSCPATGPPGAPSASCRRALPAAPLPSSLRPWEHTGLCCWWSVPRAHVPVGTHSTYFCCRCWPWVFGFAILVVLHDFMQEFGVIKKLWHTFHNIQNLEEIRVAFSR